MTSLGNMVGYGREYITRAPWIMLAPALTIVTTTLAVSLRSATGFGIVSIRP